MARIRRLSGQFVHVSHTQCNVQSVVLGLIAEQRVEGRLQGCAHRGRCAAQWHPLIPIIERGYHAWRLDFVSLEHKGWVGIRAIVTEQFLVASNQDRANCVLPARYIQVDEGQAEYRPGGWNMRVFRHVVARLGR
ncbi:hypothetical protein D3C77_575630 [compost metagenome]